MQKRRIIINALMAAAQAVVTGVGLFLLYRFLLRTIGVEQLGIWSLALALSSVAGAVNPGLAGSVVKYVALYLARNESRLVSELIQTATLATGCLSGLLLLAAWPLLQWALTLLLAGESLAQAQMILPWTLGSLWLTLLAGVLQSALDGCHRASWRSLIAIGGMIVFLLLCWLLAGAQGLRGLALAQLLQAALALIGCWLMLRRALPALPLLPARWNQKLFREMFGYSFSFQVVALCQMLYEPTTKALLTHFGGLAVTGYYEMASRLVLQLRSLLVSANQVLTPAIADLHERRPDEVRAMYRDSWRLMFSLAVPLFAALMAFTPAIAWLWIGREESVFVQSALALALGWLLNTLTVPAYFASLGTGELRWLVISHLVIAALNLLLGAIFGRVFGAGAVIVTWMLALMTGSVMIVANYHRAQRWSLSELLSSDEKRIGVASLGALLVALLIEAQSVGKFSRLTVTTMVALVFFIALALPLWRHPLRRRSLAWLVSQPG